MSKTLKDIKVKIDEDLEEKLKLLDPHFSSYRILKKAVDARGKKKPHWIMTLELYGENETPEVPQFDFPKVHSDHRPLIVGTGPAGLFAAIHFAERGVPCTLLERGSPCEKRIMAINRFWRFGDLNPQDNVCFGEGGAGLYSDGKLITRIKSPHIPYVMRKFVEFGAPPEVEFLSNPHVGSDKIRRVIPKIREYLISKGCQFLFNTQVTEILSKAGQITGVKTADNEIHESPFVILATGHSAGDIYEHLQETRVAMEGKSFAMGLRIEHPQSWVNKLQYRDHSEHPALGAANYKLTYHNKQADIGVYSFCMCPGGYVLSSGTEKDGLVTNGMSNFNRNSKYANAAVVVSIDHQRYFGNDLFGGLKMRRTIESNAYQQVQEKKGEQKLPTQKLIDFMLGRPSQEDPKGSSPSGLISTRLDQLFNEKTYLHLNEAFEGFQKKMPGFIHPEAQLYGVESRTSSPIRIIRDKENLESTSHRGLYPCGEGAGYAGGITSAACDGIRVAEVICSKMMSQNPSLLKT